MDGCPLGLGLVVEDKPTEFSYAVWFPALTPLSLISLSSLFLPVCPSLYHYVSGVSKP